MVTAAMGATVTLGAAPASAIDLGPLKECVGGSGVSNNTVDCTGSIDPPVAGLLPALGIPLAINSTASGRSPLITPPVMIGDLEAIPEIVVDPGSTAKISGLGLAIANSQLGYGHAEANAWGFLSAAVAIKAPQVPYLGPLTPNWTTGTATATSLPLGVTVAVAGTGDASALALGGFATAIGDLGGLVENVSCIALFAQASHSDVGSCTGLLFIFTVSQEKGVPGYVFAIADPTSLEILSDTGLIPLPIPHFARDILRVNFGGPSGISFESDLVPAATQTSSRVAAPAPEPTVTSSVAETETPAESEQAYVGKHRAAEPETLVEDEPAQPVWTAPATDAETETETATETEVATEVEPEVPTDVEPGPPQTRHLSEDDPPVDGSSSDEQSV